MTVGRSMDPLQFGPQPDHVRIEQYIPQSLLLPHCDALVFHGGYNSLQSAFLAWPAGGHHSARSGDNLPTGWRCAAAGAGVLVRG